MPVPLRDLHVEHRTNQTRPIRPYGNIYHYEFVIYNVAYVYRHDTFSCNLGRRHYFQHHNLNLIYCLKPVRFYLEYCNTLGYATQQAVSVVNFNLIFLP